MNFGTLLMTPLDRRHTGSEMDREPRWLLIIRRLLLSLTLLSTSCDPSGPPGRLDPGGYCVRKKEGKVWFNYAAWSALSGRPLLIPGADAQTFVWPLPNGDPDKSINYYAKDKNRVYLDGHVIPGADPATFRIVQRDSLWRDARHIFDGTSIISDDPENFEYLPGKNFCKDRQAVRYYRSSRIVPGVDPAKFQRLTAEDQADYYSDGVTLFYGTAVIRGAKASKFTYISHGYCHDGTRIYYEDRPMDGADLATLKVDADHSQVASDRHGSFLKGVRETPAREQK
jgi:DKNYY family